MVIAVEHVVEDAVGDLEAERPIALELGFAEPLIDRALVRKGWIGRGVGADAGVLDAVIAGLDVEDHAELARVTAVGRRIVDLADRMIGMSLADDSFRG